MCSGSWGFTLTLPPLLWWSRCSLWALLLSGHGRHPPHPAQGDAALLGRSSLISSLLLAEPTGFSGNVQSQGDARIGSGARTGVVRVTGMQSRNQQGCASFQYYEQHKCSTDCEAEKMSVYFYSFIFLNNIMHLTGFFFSQRRGCSAGSMKELAQ